MVTALTPGVASCRVGRPARRRDVHRGVPDRHGVHPQPRRGHVARQRNAAARTAVRRPVDRGVDAQRLGDLPDAGGRPARRHDVVRRRRGVHVDHAVRGQLPGHPDARRTGRRSARSARSAAGSSTPTARPSITELAHRAVSVPLEDIRKCAKTILICSGPPKHDATLAALRGGLAKLLVCDIDCARWLIGPMNRYSTRSEVKMKATRRVLHKLSVCAAAAGLTLTAGCAGAGSLGASDNEVTIALVSNSQMTDAQKLSSEFEKDEPRHQAEVHLAVGEPGAREDHHVDRDGRQSVRRRDDQQLRDPAVGQGRLAAATSRTTRRTRRATTRTTSSRRCGSRCPTRATCTRSRSTASRRS